MDSPKEDEVLFGWGWVHPYVRRAFLTTTPYPVRPEDALSICLSVSVRISTSAYYLRENIDVVGNVTGGSLGATFIPKDYTYTDNRGVTQENIDVFGDVSGGALGDSFLPVDYIYRPDNGANHEGVNVAGDVISGTLGADWILVEYLNWTDEGVTVVGDVARGTLS